MAARFVNSDRDTPLILPPDLRDWVSQGHLVHFILDAVSLLDLSAAHVNHPGTGEAQYPSAMMLALLIWRSPDCSHALPKASHCATACTSC